MGKIKNIISPEEDSLKFSDSFEDASVSQDKIAQKNHTNLEKQIIPDNSESNTSKSDLDFLSVPLNIFKQFFPFLPTLMPSIFSEKSTNTFACSTDSPSNLVQNNAKIKSNIGFVDEEGLLPGSVEATRFCGTIDVGDIDNTNNTETLQFLPLVQQQSLINLNLTSNGIPLYYTLSDNNQELSATQGAHGDLVFEAKLEQNGQYDFSLFSAIDRAGLTNLINNPNFESTQTVYTQTKETSDRPTIPSWDTKVVDHKNYISQTINTNPFETYQFTLYFSANQAQDKNMTPVDIYWEDELLMHLDQLKLDSHTFSFSVAGGKDSTSQLKFASDNDNVINHLIKNISVESRAQNMLPILLAFMLQDSAGENLIGDFTINVTTTPPLEINNDIPMDIMFEQSVYQTIIVNDDNSANSNPLTKINLDTLFDTLTIPEENRRVEVVQREENGVKTNVYEVMISDKTEVNDPITVADVQLSFPGGEGGLSVFSRNIIIDDL